MLLYRLLVLIIVYLLAHDVPTHRNIFEDGDASDDT